MSTYADIQQIQKYSLLFNNCKCDKTNTGKIRFSPLEFSLKNTLAEIYTHFDYPCWLPNAYYGNNNNNNNPHQEQEKSIKIFEKIKMGSV